MNRLALLTIGGTPEVVDLGYQPPVPDLQPFAATSPWRLGIAQGATFAADADTRNVAIQNTGADGSGQVWVNSTTYSHPISYAADSDPLATVTDTVHTDPNGIPAGGSWPERIPATARISAGSDEHMHVVTPDRASILEHFGAVRVSTTAYNVSRRVQVALSGSGIGPQNGVRAYGGSAIGGLIRGWEVDSTHPDYTGRIRHPLAIALRGDQLFMDTAHYGGSQGYYSSGTLDATAHPGWPAGTDATGFMLQTGYVWPATEQDWGSPSAYTGAIPMGSYFAIPPTVNLSALGLTTPQGMMLATAARDYGCYVTDSAGSSSFYCEDDAGPAQAFADAVLGGASSSAHDVRVVFNALRVVTGNDYAHPNGGPLGAARRR